MTPQRTRHSSGDSPLAIRVLPGEVVDRIAAGEVIEGPVSVVRELVDNALDAGATTLDVELVGGGLGLVRVADNGHGIPADQVELAFARHATSKIRSMDDVYALRSLGFRGEALPSIAAVADVSLTTRTADEASGSLVLAGPAGVLRREVSARQPGTTVTVRHLFGSVPARRKFLEGARTEAGKTTSLVKHLALGHAQVRFTLTIDGRLAFASRGLGDPRAALADVYGARLAAGLRPFVADGIQGWISPRTETRAGRQQLSLFINGRLTSAPRLLEALEAAYRPVLPRGRHPIALIQLRLPPEAIDPNVHPAKARVRLQHEAELAERLAAAARAALAQTPDVPAPGDDFALSGQQLSLPRPRPGRAWAPDEDDLEGRALLDALRAPRSLRQLQQSLVLVESASGFFLVDQHRAHERIIYERLRAAGADSQALLEPIVLELKPHQAQQLAERLPVLQELGFDCQHFGGHHFLLRSLPALPDGGDVTDALPSVLAEAAAPDDRWQGRLLASLACRAAVRRGRELSETEMRQMLDGLAGTSTPTACPHGSPVVLHFSDEFLRHQFHW